MSHGDNKDATDGAVSQRSTIAKVGTHPRISTFTLSFEFLKSFLYLKQAVLRVYHRILIFVGC